MAPIAKENDILTATPEAAVRPSAPAATTNEPAKVQPVALEIPVSVNGARAVDGSEKREPFSETTKTVLVFGNGAVIRLQSPVAPGQLLFVTNEKTKKEVVCQVVKSKNYRNVSGYVELEFTEQAIGFWGMRFPGDRLGPQSTTSGSVAPAAKPATPANRPAPTGPSVMSTSSAIPAARPGTSAPGSIKPPAPPAPRPDATANFNALKSSLGSGSASETAMRVDAKPAPALPAKPAPVSAAAVTPITAAPVNTAPPAKADSATENLKQQTARLQEQLASMLFVEPAAAIHNTPAAKSPEPKPAQHDLGGTAAKIVDFAKPHIVEPPASSPPVKQASAKSAETSTEEVKIPSWLEPLARNAASTSAPVEDVSRSFSEVVETQVEHHLTSDAAGSPLPLRVDEGISSSSFGSEILEQSVATRPAESGSKRGLLIAVIAAAALVIASVGTWFLRNQSNAAPIPAATAASSAGSIATNNQPVSNSTGASTNAGSANSAVAAIVKPEVAPAVTAAPAAASSGSSSERTTAASKPSNSSPSTTVTSERREVAAAEPKKPSLGQVKLAKPTLARGGRTQVSADGDPGIALGGASIPSDALSGTISENNSQPSAPAAPVPVGGDVRPAKLISSVPPAYPSLARSQHVGGDVKVDALIDGNGRVTTMKIVSGPTLLHQAAMDALRQWRYQPATLDGKPVPMHLTVTLQFRLQ